MHKYLRLRDKNGKECHLRVIIRFYDDTFNLVER